MKEQQVLSLSWRLPDFNTYMNTNRANRYAGNAIKQQETNSIFLECKRQRLAAFSRPVRIKYVWYVKNRAMDPDNVAFAKKFIHDGLVLARVLTNDNLNWIKGFDGDDFIITKDREGVDIYLTPCDN